MLGEKTSYFGEARAAVAKSMLLSQILTHTVAEPPMPWLQLSAFIEVESKRSDRIIDV